MRVLVTLLRPAVLLTLGLFAMLGLAQAGASADHLLAAQVMVVVTGYVLCSVVLNDLADEAIDEVNRPDSGTRPLLSGIGTRRDLRVVAGVASLAALGAAASISRLATGTVAVGLVLAAVYSLPPLRLSRRGVVAPLVLPAVFVCVPFLVSVFGVRDHLRRDDVILMVGLYAGFIGRIILKDFRDVRGDVLFGKRTFLVRRGRVVTCVVSGASWIIGAACLLGVRDLSVAVVVVVASCVAAAIVLLHRLAHDPGHRIEERLISSIAIVGRLMVATITVHLAATDQGAPGALVQALVVGLALVMFGQAATMVRFGPAPRRVVPTSWLARGTAHSPPAGGA